MPHFFLANLTSEKYHVILFETAFWPVFGINWAYFIKPAIQTKWICRTKHYGKSKIDTRLKFLGYVKDDRSYLPPKIQLDWTKGVAVPKFAPKKIWKTGYFSRLVWSNDHSAGISTTLGWFYVKSCTTHYVGLNRPLPGKSVFGAKIGKIFTFLGLAPKVKE